MLMVAGTEDHAAIRAMLGKAESVTREIAKPQNPSPLLVKDGTIQDFEVDASSPVYHEGQRAKKVAALLTYEDQKANLDRHHKEVGKDIFVASFKLQQAKTGEYSSFSTWCNGIPTLLPETDQVIFFEPKQPEQNRIVARVPWNRAIEVVSDLMLDTKMFPPRYYVSKFPTPDQLKALQAPN